MRQRKLNSEQICHADEASSNIARISSWDELDGGDKHWRGIYEKLRAFAVHGTTDGKPWIEPQPEIGDGYRLATLSDAHRRDRQVWCDGFWLNAQIGHTETNRVYSVPIDRIPTDEDAKQRPTVMVAGDPENGWHARPLLGVTKMGFLVASGDGFTNWKHARFPYPGELD
jgi:hypothetical protein